MKLPPLAEDELWFDRPAGSWLEALPLGNGRLGVMAHGGVDLEHLQINDATAWSGGPYSEQIGEVVDPVAAAAAITAARTAVTGEDFAEAGRQVQRLQHRHSQSYLPFVDLRVDQIQRQMTCCSRSASNGLARPELSTSAIATFLPRRANMPHTARAALATGVSSLVLETHDQRAG